jgi:hypothetical protein
MEQTGGFLRNALFIPKPMKFSFATIFLRHIWLSKCNNKISCLCSEEIDALMPLLVEKEISLYNSVLPCNGHDQVNDQSSDE